MIALVLGRRELGKTTLALYMAQRHGQTIVLDARSLVPTDDPITDLPVDSPELLARLYDDPPEALIVVQPQDDLAGTSDALARVVREWCQQSQPADRLAVVLDEAALLDLRAWDWIIRCSPRDRLLVILTAHRPQDLPTTVRAMADDWCLFRMTQRHDLQHVEDKCGDRVVACVRALEPRQFVRWDDAHAKMIVYRDPAVWFVPLVDLSRVGRGALTLPAGDRDRTLLDDEADA